ncbi:MAG TPA: NlpC/P60 family protein [Elusimicrobia bacterium]|nr:NlpC/P60 family protein [Elusimicrobiota bacterium]
MRRGGPLLLATALALCACVTPPRRGTGVPKRAATAEAKALLRTAKSYLPEEEKDRAQPKDCSDFVGKVFAEHGIKLPRTSLEMSKLGQPIASSKALSMGDLVFFSGEKISHTVGHVGIYVSNGIFIHFTKPSVGVTLESLYSDYYRKRYLKSRRVLP